MGKIIDMFVNIKKKLMEDNLKKVIEMCQKIAFDHHGGSILTFKPIDEDRYLYDELVARGIMSVDPIEKDRFVFTQDLKDMYQEVPVKEIISPDVGLEEVKPKEDKPKEDKPDDKPDDKPEESKP